MEREIVWLLKKCNRRMEVKLNYLQSIHCSNISRAHTSCNYNCGCRTRCIGNTYRTHHNDRERNILYTQNHSIMCRVDRRRRAGGRVILINSTAGRPHRGFIWCNYHGRWTGEREIFTANSGRPHGQCIVDCGWFSGTYKDGGRGNCVSIHCHFIRHQRDGGRRAGWRMVVITSSAGWPQGTCVLCCGHHLQSIQDVTRNNTRCWNGVITIQMQWCWWLWCGYFNAWHLWCKGVNPLGNDH